MRAPLPVVDGGVLTEALSGAFVGGGAVGFTLVTPVIAVVAVCAAGISIAKSGGGT